MMRKQLGNLKEKMRPEARARAGEKAESLLRGMSSTEPRTGRPTEDGGRANKGEAAVHGADSETAK